MEIVLNEIIQHELLQITSLENLKEVLQVRLSLIGRDYAKKDEFEKNEVDILKIKTQIEINKISLSINQKKEEFKETFGRLIEELDFLEKNIE